MHARSAWFTAVVWVVLSGCESSGAPGGMSDAIAQSDAGDDSGLSTLGLPWESKKLGPVPYPADNAPSEAKRRLGRLLFYDPIVSSDRATACVTCHSEI